VPIFMYFLGTIPAERYEESLKPGGPILPSMHSDQYAPVPEASIEYGVKTLTMAALDLLDSKKDTEKEK
jgi:hypothetical protein